MKLQNLIDILIGIVCIGLFPNAQALSPAPDGGYPGGNTAEGQNALLSLTTGGYNTALGFFSLTSNTLGAFNTAIGAGTLLANTGDSNTATGAGALFSDTAGIQNTANGAFALFSNTEGNFNTATGHKALFNNTTGSENTATGAGALLSNTTGNNNTVVGENALQNNTTGNSNIVLGAFAGENVTTGRNVICIGLGGSNVNNSCFIANIFGVTPGPYTPVVIDSNGKLGTVNSSRRFKKKIKPMAQASEAILALKPVTFHYKSDPAGAGPQFGLIAEEVAEVNPNLVVRDENGEIYTVRYDAVNAMLLNEFLKEHKTVEEQEATITQLKLTGTRQDAIMAQQRKEFEATTAQQQKGMEAVVARLDEQAGQIQKVSKQLAAASPSRGGLNVSKFATGRIRRGGTAPQIVLNNQ